MQKYRYSDNVYASFEIEAKNGKSGLEAGLRRVATTTGVARVVYLARKYESVWWEIWGRDICVGCKGASY